MAQIVENDQVGIRILKLASGKANALDPPVVDELLSAVRRASADETVGGVVLASDRPRFFSAGFDVKLVFQFDRPAMAEFFGAFIDLYEALLRMPKPVVAAISGHAVAGGAVLALTADQRVFAEGEGRFALMEVDIGVELPAKAMRMMIAAAGPGAAADVLLAGASLSPERALAVGLASEIAPAAEVLGRALTRCQALAAKPRGAFASIKRSLQEAAGISQSRSDRDCLDHFLDQWFSPESIGARRRLAEALQR